MNLSCEVKIVVGYIDVGGGMRAVYGAGVLDFCLDEGISFPYYLGVSAGSANIISFLGGHRGRTLRFYRDYSYRKEYMSFQNFVKNKSYLGLDYIYSTLTNENGEDPLSFENMRAQNCRFQIVSTNANTGKAEYFDHKGIIKDNYTELKASCCIPVICRPIERNGSFYYDGGLTDPIPVKKALADGCDRVVVTLTLPKTYYKPHKAPKGLYKYFLRNHPKASALMYSMIDKYNEDLFYLQELERQGRALIIAPDDCCGVTTLKHKKENVVALYKKGYEDAKRIKAFIESDTEVTP